MILLNGAGSELEAGQTVTAALSALGLSEQARGVAVAIDGEVVPRARWHEQRLLDGARVEVLTAMQGG